MMYKLCIFVIYKNNEMEINITIKIIEVFG